MALFDSRPVCKPYVVEFEDGSEVKVDGYDVQEAMFTGVLKRNRECGTGEGPTVVGVRPDADVLKQRALDEGVFRRLIAGVGRSRLVMDEPEEDEE